MRIIPRGIHVNRLSGVSGNTLQSEEVDHGAYIGRLLDTSSLSLRWVIDAGKQYTSRIAETELCPSYISGECALYRAPAHLYCQHMYVKEASSPLQSLRPRCDSNHLTRWPKAETYVQCVGNSRLWGFDKGEISVVEAG